MGLEHCRSNRSSPSKQYFFYFLRVRNMWHKGKKSNSVTISYDYHDMLSGSLIFYFLQFNNSQAYLDKIVVRILQALYHCLLNSNPCSVPCIHDPTLYLYCTII